MSLSRRRFLTIFGGTAATALLAACVQQAPAPTAAPAKPTEAPKPAGEPTKPAAPAASPAAGASPVASPAASPAAAAPQAAPAAGTKMAEVVIGAAYPLSGPSGPAGLDAKAAVEVAQEAINSPGPLANSNLPMMKGQGLPNLGGARIRFIITDHQGDPARGQAEAERLIQQERVAAVFGMFQSAVTLTASAVCERLGVPYFTAESSSPSLHTRGFRWFFRTSPHDIHFSQAMFDFFKEFQARKSVQLKTIGLTYEDTEFGTSSSKAQKELAQQAGMEVKEDIQYRARGTSLTSEIQRLKASQPDVWMPTSYISDAILMVKTSKEIDYNPKMVMAQNSGHTENAFIEQVGTDAEGYMSRAVYSPDLLDKIPVLKDFNTLFRAKANKDISDVPARVLLGVSVLADAINRAGGVEPDKIRQALLATDLKTDQLPLPWRGVKFDPATGQNDLGTPIIVQMQGGRYQTVWPFDVAAKDVIFPIPEWSKR